MTTKRKATPMALGEESFGERLHRAYVKGRTQYRYSYDSVAELISEFAPTSGQTLRRMEWELEVFPTRPRHQVLAFLALLAYGFEPNDFGLHDSEISLHPEVVKAARKNLPPKN